MWTLIFEWKLVKMKFLPSMKSFGNLLRKVFSNSIVFLSKLYFASSSKEI